MEENLEAFYSQILHNQLRFLALAHNIQSAEEAYFLAQFAVENPCNIFANYECEKQFLYQAKQIRAEISEKYKPNSTLHILSEITQYDSASYCAQQWAEIMQDNSCIAVLHQQDPHLIPQKFTDKIKSLGCEIILFEQEAITRKAAKLRTLASSFEKIVLHLHQDDPTALIAFGSDDFPRVVITYNHAECGFWLGSSISDVVLNISQKNKQIGEFFRCLGERAKFASYPFNFLLSQNEPLSMRSAREILGIPLNAKVIYSEGSSSHFMPIPGVNFEVLIRNFLKVKPDTLFYINTDFNALFWNKLASEFRHNIFDAKKLEPKYKNTIIAASDLIINSIPTPNTALLVESVNAKKPFLSLKDALFTDYLVSISYENITELIKKALVFFDNTKLAQGHAEHTEIFLRKAANPQLWKERIKQILSDLPPAHKVHHFPSIVPTRITNSVLYNCLFLRNRALNLMDKADLHKKGDVELMRILKLAIEEEKKDDILILKQ